MEKQIDEQAVARYLAYRKRENDRRRGKQYKHKDPEARAEYDAQYRETHREQIREYNRAYYLRKKEEQQKSSGDECVNT
jgi:hypothetical protein